MHTSDGFDLRAVRPVSDRRVEEIASLARQIKRQKDLYALGLTPLTAIKQLEELLKALKGNE